MRKSYQILGNESEKSTDLDIQTVLRTFLFDISIIRCLILLHKEMFRRKKILQSFVK